MRRWSCIGAVAAAIVASTTAMAGAQGLPQLVSVSSSHRHLVLVARFGNLTPATVAAAIKPTTSQGVLVTANVRYRARLDHVVRRADGTVRWRSPVKLPSRTYWIQVTGVQTDGATDCPPKLHNCTTMRSNVLRVRLR
jgi:hypothetical protein